MYTYKSSIFPGTIQSFWIWLQGNLFFHLTTDCFGGVILLHFSIFTSIFTSQCRFHLQALLWCQFYIAFISDFNLYTVDCVLNILQDTFTPYWLFIIMWSVYSLLFWILNLGVYSYHAFPFLHQYFICRLSYGVNFISTSSLILFFIDVIWCCILCL